MIIHVALLKPKTTTTNEDMEAILEQVRTLRPEIQGLLDIQAGPNQNPNHQGYTFGFSMRYTGSDDLHASTSHPKYQEVSRELQRLCESVLECDLTEMPPPPRKKLRDTITEQEWQSKSVEDRLKILLMDQLGVREEDLIKSASFVEDLNADSLDLVEIIMGMEEEFQVEISDEQAEKITTVGEALEFLSKGESHQEVRKKISKIRGNKR
jgi:acyl carrier protein